MTVSLWVPLQEAQRFGMDDLVITFGEAAEAAGGELVDDSETMGSWEWFEFSGLSPERIKVLAAQVLPDHRDITLATQAPDDQLDPGDHVILTM